MPSAKVLPLERGEGRRKLPARAAIPSLLPPTPSRAESAAAAVKLADLPWPSLVLLLLVEFPAATLWSRDRVRVLGMEPEIVTAGGSFSRGSGEAIRGLGRRPSLWKPTL